MPDEAVVEHINVGRPRTVTNGDREVTTAIWKAPVTGPVAVRHDNIDGDEQADLEVHGGPDKAIYAYAAEDAEWWEAERSAVLGAGAFGENLTTRGLDVTNARIGEQWAIGTTLLQVVQPRLPCSKLALRMGDPLFVKAFTKARRPGAYLRILEEGEMTPGDAVRVVHRPTHDVSVGVVADAYTIDRTLLARVLTAGDDLTIDWQERIQRRLDKQS